MLCRFFVIENVLLGILTEAGRRDAAYFVKNAVELGKTGESTALGNVGDFDIGIEQQLLSVLDPCHLNIAYQGKPGNLLELVGQIVGADIEFL